MARSDPGKKCPTDCFKNVAEVLATVPCPTQRPCLHRDRFPACPITVSLQQDVLPRLRMAVLKKAEEPARHAADDSAGNRIMWREGRQMIRGGFGGGGRVMAVLPRIKKETTMKLIRRCAACNTNLTLRMFTSEKSYRCDKEDYCSMVCMTRSGDNDFCERCLSNTIPESPGHISTIVGYDFFCFMWGTTLLGTKERCDHCHSIVQKKFIIIAGIPLIPLAKYRIKYLNDNSFIGRKMARVAG